MLDCARPEFNLVPVARIAVQTPLYAVDAVTRAVKRSGDPERVLRYGDYIGVSFANSGRQNFTTTRESFWRTNLEIQHTSDELIFLVAEEHLGAVLAAIQNAHPYEEPVCCVTRAQRTLAVHEYKTHISRPEHLLRDALSIMPRVSPQPAMALVALCALGPAGALALPGLYARALAAPPAWGGRAALRAWLAARPLREPAAALALDVTLVVPHLARSGLNAVFALECVSLCLLAFFLADPGARLGAGGAWALWVVNALKHVALLRALGAAGARAWRTVREHGLIEPPLPPSQRVHPGGDGASKGGDLEADAQGGDPGSSGGTSRCSETDHHR